MWQSKFVIAIFNVSALHSSAHLTPHSGLMGVPYCLAVGIKYRFMCISVYTHTHIVTTNRHYRLCSQNYVCTYDYS